MILRKNFKNLVFQIDPKKIRFCTAPSKYIQFTQFKLDKNHPHAGKNRGYFSEDINGGIILNKKNWDKPGVEFKKLPEFVALYNHYFAKEKWRYSNYANRLKNYILSGGIKKKFNKNNQKWKTSKFNMKLLKYILDNKIDGKTQVDKIIIEREYEINRLIESIQKKGIVPCKSKKNLSNDFNNNISINLSYESKLFFNNRGHHRLAIAKIIKLNSIPIKITATKSLEALKKFYKFLI
jgi:hypothetical protein